MCKVYKFTCTIYLVIRYNEYEWIGSNLNRVHVRFHSFATTIIISRALKVTSLDQRLG